MKAFLAKFLDKTFWKFILVGVLNTLVGSGVMFALYNWCGASYWLSSAANYVVGSIVSYFLNKYFTFEVKERSFKFIARFVINILVCYGIAYGLAKPLVRMILSGCSVTLQDNGAMLVGMCLFVLLNYVGQRFFAFKQDSPKPGAAADEPKQDA